MSARSALINVMVKAAEKAGRRLVKDFGEVEKLQVSRKGPADFVSHADIAAEKIIAEELRKARPKFGLKMEEGTVVEGEGPQCFVVDPLDGTTNFLHGIPHFAVSIAMMDGRAVLAGVIYNPVLDELFWAERGAGAWLASGRSDQRLRVSGRDKLPDALIGTGAPFLGRGDSEQFLAEAGRVMGATSGIRRIGAAALDLAYVAMGRFDGYWERGLNIWDIAAGVLLVKEAGGFVSDLDGRDRMLENGDVLAANDRLHAPLLKLVRGK